MVHINAGIAGLASALMLGKRQGLGRESMAPYNLTLTVVGASLLWVGWFGFNAGSAVASDGRAGMAFAATHIATAAAALAWMFTEWVICFFSSTAVKRAFGYDDSLDAFGVHCIGGIVGALLTGALVSKEISGATGSVLLQLKGVTATLVWSFVMSIIILKLIDLTIGLRVTADEEREGLDITQHGESIE